MQLTTDLYNHIYKVPRSMEFYLINASKGEMVKGNYHIQHVNSTHNRIKKWIENTFWGVSTKYLQQYLNWYRIKESIKFRNERINAFVEKNINIGVLKHFDQIHTNYQKIISTLEMEIKLRRFIKNSCKFTR